MTPTGPALFHFPLKKFVLARIKTGIAGWQRRGNRKVSLWAGIFRILKIQKSCLKIVS